MDYFKRKIYIPRVNVKDEAVGKIERWEAHRKAILHRGFTVAVFIGDKIICQHRKHLVFDGLFDLTASSHQKYIGGKLQNMSEAIYDCLKREWGMKESDISGLKFVKKAYYKAKSGEFWEHEVDHFYTARIIKAPRFNPEVAYGYSLFTAEDLNKPQINKLLAPWVKKLVVKI